MRLMLPANLDAIYLGIGLTACVLALISWSLLRRKASAQPDAGRQARGQPGPVHVGAHVRQDRSDDNLLDAIIERQSPRSGRQRTSRRGPGVRQLAASGPQLSALE